MEEQIPFLVHLRFLVIPNLITLAVSVPFSVHFMYRLIITEAVQLFYLKLEKSLIFQSNPTLTCQGREIAVKFVF